MITHSRLQMLWTVSLNFNRKFSLIECERGDKPVLACSSWGARLCCALLWRRLFANDTAHGAHWRLIHAIHGAACIRPPGIDLAPMICLCSEARSGSGRDFSVLKAFVSQRAWKREEKLRAEMYQWQRAPVMCVCLWWNCVCVNMKRFCSVKPPGAACSPLPNLCPLPCEIMALADIWLFPLLSWNIN